MEHKAFRKKPKAATVQDILQNGGIAPEGFRLPGESALAGQLRSHMELKGWMTLKIHGSVFMTGFPDLIAIHPEHGIRFIETKSMREGHKLERSQVVLFERMHKHGAKVHVLRGPHEYDLIFGPANWHRFI